MSRSGRIPRQPVPHCADPDAPVPGVSGAAHDQQAALCRGRAIV